MISCGVSIAGVALLLVLGGPLYSLVGVFLGEAVFAIWIWRQRRALASGDAASRTRRRPHEADHRHQGAERGKAHRRALTSALAAAARSAAR
jgi:hypothetical protein